MIKFNRFPKPYFSLLEEKDRVYLGVIGLCQVVLNFMDLVGIALIGVVGAVSVNGLQSKTVGNRADQVLNLLKLSNLSFESQVVLLSLISALVLITKTLLSLFFSRKLIRFLAFRNAELSSKIFQKILKQNFLKLNMRTPQENYYYATAGAEAIFSGVIYSIVSLITDFSLLIILVIGLLVVDWIIGMTALLFFGSLSLFLFIYYSKTSRLNGIKFGKLSIKSSEMFFQIFKSFKEIFVTNRQQYYISRISKVRFDYARLFTVRQSIPVTLKYIMEVALVIGCAIIALIQYSFYDVARATATLSVFFAASSRIIPALVRIQQSALKIRQSSGEAEDTLKFFWETTAVEQDTYSSNNKLFSDVLIPEILVENVSFKYPGSKNWIFKNVSLEINPGEFVAIVGSSGVGKSTFVDLLLGIISPTSGEIKISGENPQTAILHFSGEISYMSQDSSLFHGTIRDNILLGRTNFSDNEIYEAIESANGSEILSNLPDGLGTYLGESGFGLSGGQLQRLALARALLSRPKILILDEPTSSLDTNSESALNKTFKELKGKVTLIIVAHKKVTIEAADKIINIKKDGIMLENIIAKH